MSATPSLLNGEALSLAPSDLGERRASFNARKKQFSRQTSRDSLMAEARVQARKSVAFGGAAGVELRESLLERMSQTAEVGSPGEEPRRRLSFDRERAPVGAGKVAPLPEAARAARGSRGSDDSAPSEEKDDGTGEAPPRKSILTGKLKACPSKIESPLQTQPARTVGDPDKGEADKAAGEGGGEAEDDEDEDEDLLEWPAEGAAKDKLLYVARAASSRGGRG
jgi:hypothetical protein